MAKYVKEVEALQFTPAEDEKQFAELVIDGASTIVHAGDFIEYENGVPVDVWSEGQFRSKHKELVDEMFIMDTPEEPAQEAAPKKGKK